MSCSTRIRMRVFLLVILLCISTEVYPCEGQAPLVRSDSQLVSPEWVVQQFFVSRVFPDRSEYFTPRFAKMIGTSATPGAVSSSEITVSSRQLTGDSAHAIFETEVRHSDHIDDWYTYLVRKGAVWQIDAVRLFSVPAIQFVLLDTLMKRHTLPDSLVAVRDRMKLIVTGDSALKNYFRINQGALARLASHFESVPGLRGVADDGRSRPESGVSESEKHAVVDALRSLRLGAALRDPDVPQCVRYKIGGSDQGTAGFLHTLPGCPPQIMDPDEFMYLEPVGPDWYVYRTG